MVRVATNAALDELRRKKGFFPAIVARDAPEDIVDRDDVVSACGRSPGGNKRSSCCATSSTCQKQKSRRSSA